jgi:hypothetical protein
VTPGRTWGIQLVTYGIPLHAWGTATFRTLVKNCGTFLEVDDETLTKKRLDVARVKIEAPLGGRIDFV